MRINLNLKLTAWSLAVSASMSFAAPQTMTWHVSPNGNDAWSGRRTEPVRGDGPMATIRAALVTSRKHAGKPRRIQLAAGRYYVKQTLVLEANDAGLTIEGAGQGKTVVYGGQRITSWRRDGERFWVADVPEVKTGKWDFRALVVNDRLCPRARLPETGRFTHETRFPVRWMSTAGGGWERKPTQEERTTMQYRAGDLGPWLSVRNAEVTVYHMWDESMIGVKVHIPATRTLTFSSPCGHPPGAFGKRTYVLWNVREGMKKPGQWYLDRDAGQIVYWPLPGEDMSKAIAVAPRVETIFELRGIKTKPVPDIALKSLTLTTTTTPCKAGGFGASRYRGALHAAWGERVVIANVEITNTAGHAIREWGSRDLRIEDCHLHHLGAGGLRGGGGTGRIEGNRIHHIGMLYPSAIGLSASGREGTYVIRRNEIHDTPYSAMAIGGTGTIIEENLIYRCMQVLQDGAAIYVSGAKGNIIRRNVARDIVKVGKGYGVSSYYLDEKCRDCIVEKNVSIGVERPNQNHMTLNCAIRDNVFINAGGMSLGTSRCAGLKFIGNTFQLDGALRINDPDAVTEWKGNLIVQTGAVTPAISDAMPRPRHTPRNKPLYANAGFLTKPPVLDGKLNGEEWPPGGRSLSECPDQRRARGAPIMVKFAADTSALYVGLSVVSMFPEDRKLGHTWGTDEGVEIAVQGKLADGKPVTYVLRGFADGTLESLTAAGATAGDADALRKAAGYAAGADKKVWQCEWRIPLAALRFIPADRMPLPVNVTVYRSENKGFIQFAGTLGETWDLARGGRLIFRNPKSSAKPRPRPIAQSARTSKAPVIDGRASEEEWPGEALVMKQTPGGVPISGKACDAHIATDGKSLFVHMSIPASRVTRGSEWRKDDGAEVCIRGKTPGGKPVVWVVRGFAGGAYRSSTEAGTPEATSKALGRSVRFRAFIGKAGWQGEWAIPLKALGVTIAANVRVPFNLGIFRSESGEWVNWIGTRGPTWKLEKAGLLRTTE
ncbi:MAG: right-handed parallel beta-helix repeat-containing protein [Planctomycetota bacterium]|nr:right-handed parallel beta-helix repeat-containing protein [Planctomycetota bacterium]